MVPITGWGINPRSLAYGLLGDGGVNGESNAKQAEKSMVISSQKGPHIQPLGNWDP